VESVLARINSNRSLLRILLSEFHTQNQTAVADIRQAIQAHDLERTLFLVHGLKGVVANIGAGALAATTQQLEDALKKEAEAAFPELLEEMTRQMAEVSEAAAIMEKENLSSPPPVPEFS
jgi:two-component system, sensor histidine kinase and response regulator